MCRIICFYVYYEIGYCLFFQKHKNRKRKTKMARYLTKEEEDEVIEWLRTNQFLCDKSSFEFKNHPKKERAWLEMDHKMRLNSGDLYRWYTSLRTQYVKEVKKKENATRSGAGAVNDIMTPRITWLLEKFEFVKQYVCHREDLRLPRHAHGEDDPFLPGGFHP